MEPLMSPQEPPWEIGVGLFEDDIETQKARVEGVTLEDRRRSPRILLSIPVRYRVRRQNHSWETASSINLSSYGIRIAVVHPISAGTPIDLWVKLPRICKPFQLEGTVVWTSPSFHDKTITECGIAFEGVQHLHRKEELIHFIAEHLCSSALRLDHKIIHRPVESLDELKATYQLVYKEYLARGYCVEHPSQTHYSFFSLLPQTRTFVLEKDRKFLATAGLVCDSDCGLPMEANFAHEVAKLRHSGRRLAEVYSLALEWNPRGEKYSLLNDTQKVITTLCLLKILLDYARFVAGVTDLVIAVRPQDSEFYRFLNFEVLGSARPYTELCGKTVLPMRLDLEQFVKRISLSSAIGRHFLRNSVPLELLQRHFRWTAEVIRDLVGVTRLMWTQFPSMRQAYLQHCYPGLSLFI